MKAFPCRLLFLPVILAWALSGCQDQDPHAGPAAQALPLRAANPIKRTVQLTNTFTGRFVAIEEVELRARVSGYLQAANFTEGKPVKKGDLMFQIDPRVFEAAHASADAKVKQAAAALDLANISLERARKLVTDAAISKQEFDTRQSEASQADADLAAARAELRRAQLDVEFARIEAPISGIAGKFEVTPGNFVSGGNAAGTLLTTIVPHDPIYCTFYVDERQVLQFTRLYFEGQTDGREGEATQVEIAVSDTDKFEYKGMLDYADNQLEKGTATMLLRARVENKNQFLTPGLFAKVRVPIGKSAAEVTLVRDEALGFDQSKRYAWVVLPDKSVERRFVEVGAAEGPMRVVTGGLKVDDVIAISNLQLLQPGAKVEPKIKPMDPAEEAKLDAEEAAKAKPAAEAKPQSK